ncbi:Dyad-like protein [Thalictrum thalictroides]|uniref:Dyad-like protein n=1 Tax=Thalictrum thalictroides TaxID=46969 RepID=A0A7J6X321_THATH|nr:Dyad-like protein [Thalictrum thalictroides]
MVTKKGLTRQVSESKRCKQGFTEAEDMSDMKWLKKHDVWMEDEQKPFIGRHLLPPPDSSFSCYVPESEELKVGFLYELDHKQLPLESPSQLEVIRAVMVSQITTVKVHVRSPSALSLDRYFSRMNSQNVVGIEFDERKYPDLDEQFTMCLKLARKVLVRLISPTEFSQQGHLRSFWLLPSKEIEISTSISNGDTKDENLLKGVCWAYLNSSGLVHWGAQKRRIITERQPEKSPEELPLSSLIKVEEEEDIKTNIKTKDETECNTRKREPEIWNQNKRIKLDICDTKTDIKTIDEMKCKKQNRKHEGRKHNKKSKTDNHEVKKPSGKTCRPTLKLCYGWWSEDRYKNAEVKMMDIMNAKGAVSEKPIIRQTLRLEARKHIGDTGLLDHVLKHMADKVTPNGEQRFRRRHNPDGAMEYWLESADLVNVRRKAGVKDPYWTPPPGWKLGDNPSQDPNCARELNLLKEEMSIIKKDVQELHLLKREDEVDKAIVLSRESSSEICNSESDTKAISLQEDYENLVKRKSQLEQQLAQIRKRKHDDWKQNKKSKEARHVVKKPSSKLSKQKLNLSYGRWSQPRYKNAEVKMWEILKAKGAVSGKPIVRQALRLEARKHIGDTGLLDHVLKHMADKVTPNGIDRFRRRHNAVGTMEYWLESADLVNVRREAGVKDPYWTPPPGWKPGDNPSQDPNYARELKLLKEEMSKIEKDVQALLSKREDEGDNAMTISTKSSESCNLESETRVVSLKDDYVNTVKRKSHFEQQRTHMSESLNGVQDSFVLGNNFHLPQHDATSNSGIQQLEQGSITSYLVGPPHPHGSAAIERNNFFRMRPCDFGQSLDTEPKESSFYLLV